MKNYLNYITAALFLGLTVFASCGGGSDDPEVPDDPREEVADMLTGTVDNFTVATPAGATLLEWADFTLTLSGGVDGGTYSTTNTGDTGVWPASGTWEFANTSGSQIRRDDDVLITLTTLTDTGIVMDFPISQPAAKAGVIEGNWKFTGEYQ